MQVPLDSVAVVDLSALRCPALGRRIRKALFRAAPGEMLHFISTDPLAAIDIPHLIAGLGDEIVKQETDSMPAHWVVRKKLRD